MRLEPVVRGLVLGLIATQVVLGGTSILFREPPAIIQFLQMAHDTIGYVLVPIGILYVLVHLYQTLDASVMRRQARTLLATLTTRRGIPALVTMVVIVALATSSFVRFGATATRRYAALGIQPRALLVVIALTAVASTIAVIASALLVVTARRHGLGRLSVRWFALATTVTCVIAALSMPLYVAGRGGSVDAVWLLHVSSAALALVLLSTHVIASRRARRARRGPAKARFYPWRWPVAIVALPTFAIAVGWAVWWAHRNASGIETPRLDPDAIHLTDVGMESIVPGRCQGCHPEQTGGWRISAHAGAADNPVFKTLVLRAYAEAGPEVARTCLACHAPHAPDPTRRPIDEVIRSAGYQSGVTCFSCHRTRPGPGHGDGSLDTEPLSNQASTFLMDRPGLVAEEVADGYAPRQLIAGRLGLHRSTYRMRVTTSEACLPCHHQTLTIPSAGRFHDVLQTQFDSWRASPAAAAGTYCRNCHMPHFVNEVGKTYADHRMLGASTWLAARRGGAPALEAVVGHLRGEYAVPIGSERAAPAPPATPLLAVAGEVVATERGPALRVRTKQTGGIGHSFPNGPSDLLEVWLAARVGAADGTTWLDVGEEGPDGAPQLGHRFRDASGAAIVDHSLWRVAGITDLGTIPPSGEHVLELPLPAGASAERATTVSLEWKYRRVDPAVAATLGADDLDLPVVTMARYQGVSTSGLASTLPAEALATSASRAHSATMKLADASAESARSPSSGGTASASTVPTTAPSASAPKSMPR